MAGKKKKTPKVVRKAVKQKKGEEKKVTTSKQKAVKKASKKMLVEVEKLAVELIDHLGVAVEVKVKADKEGAILIQLESEDSGMLIGYHGDTLSSFQLILTMMTYRKTDEWVRVLVNVGDYRERRRESLERMALSMAQRAKFAGEPQALPFMNSAERRMIHLALANDPEVATESEGEGYQRRVVVKPKK